MIKLLQTILSFKTFSSVSLAFFISLYCALFWFRPVFWEMADQNTGYVAALFHIFADPDLHKANLGSGVDFLGTMWIFSQVDQMLLGQSSPLIHGIYYPLGFDLGKHTGFAWADAILAWPWMRLLGIPGFYNIHILTMYIMTQMAALALFRSAKASWPVSVGLSMLVVFHPFGIGELYSGRPTQLHWFFHCIYLLSLLKLHQGRSIALWGLIGGVCMAGSCLVYWFGGAAIVFCGMLAYLLSLWHGPWKVRRLAAALLLIGIGALIAITVTHRVSLPILLGNGEILFPQLQDPPQLVLSTPFFDIPVQRIIEIRNGYDVLNVITTCRVPLVILSIALCCIILSFRYRNTWPWLVTMIVAIGIPMGPAFAWKGGWTITGYALLHAVFPPLLRCQDIERMMVAPVLIICLYFALLSARLLQNRNLYAWAIGLLLCGFAFSALPTKEQARYMELPYDDFLYRSLAQQPGAIIDVPLKESERNYIHQLQHNQPILGGPGMNRVQSQEHRVYTQENQFIEALNHLAMGKDPPSYPLSHYNKLYRDGFRTLLIDKRASLANISDFETMLGTKAQTHPKSPFVILPMPEELPP